MKKAYKQPTIKVVELSLRTSMMGTSFGEGIEVTGTDGELGDDEDFA